MNVNVITGVDNLSNPKRNAYVFANITTIGLASFFVSRAGRSVIPIKSLDVSHKCIIASGYIGMTVSYYLFGRYVTDIFSLTVSTLADRAIRPKTR